MSVERGSLSDTPGDSLPRARTARASVELFLISFFMLFFELACIRWLGSTVMFLTFFTNIVLMACFLGVSVGCLAAARRWSWMNAFVPVAIVATASACGFLWVYNAFGQVMVDVGSQQSPQLIYFGTDARVKDPSKWVVPIEMLAGYFFVLVALMFIGPGQEMGRRFAAIDNRLLAYSADILGSLAGIAVFGVMSYFHVPAVIWFLIALAIGVWFVPRRRWSCAGRRSGARRWLRLADWPWDAHGCADRGDLVSLLPGPVQALARLSIDVNNLGHQGMVRVESDGPGYFLPHLLNRDAGGKPFDDVLIVGAGSGNDVAAALSSRRRPRRRRRDRPGDQRTGTASSSQPAVQRPEGLDSLGRWPRIHSQDPVAIRSDQLCPGRFVGLALELFERSPGELPVHRAGVSRREGQAQARRRLRDVQLLPPGLGGGPAGEAGRDRIRLAADRRLGALSGESSPRATISAITSRFSWSATGLAGGRSRSGRSLQPERFFWLNPQPRLNESVNGFGAAPPVSKDRPDLPEGRAGRRSPSPRARSFRPTTGRFCIFASRRFPHSIFAAWRSWPCSRW